eukprot:s10527_g1.t1
MTVSIHEEVRVALKLCTEVLRSPSDVCMRFLQQSDVVGLQLEKLLRASTACDDVLLSVLAVARGPLFKADASEGKAAAAQPFLSSRCPI